MNLSKAMLFTGLSLALFLTGCRSRQEAAGDKYRKMGNPLQSLMQYEEALKRGEVSKEFYKNYTLVNIQAMDLRAKEDPTAEFLDILKDTVASLLTQYPDPANQTLFASVLSNIASARIKMGTPEAVEGGFRFLSAAEKAGAAGGSGAKDQVVALKIKEVESDFKDAATEPTSGIVADYKMNKLALMIGVETPAMSELWSKIRKLNLNTYLMYDNDDVLAGLGERPDARINRFGVLLGIVKYEAGSTTTKIQVKAWNGASLPFHYRGDGFTLFDKDGNAYTPTAKIGGFAKTDKDVIQKGEESKTGGLTFTHPAGAKPAYLEFKCEAGLSRKYLP
jgi:hypothetical protein